MLVLSSKAVFQTTVICFLLASCICAQSIYPSNSSNDLYAYATSPRFLLNGTEFSGIRAVQLAPLGEYATVAHSTFLRINIEGHLVNVDASNANSIDSQEQFSYISCDPADYNGNLGPNDVFRIVMNSPKTNIVILYSQSSAHCAASGLDSLPQVGGVLTTTDVVVAGSLAQLNLNQDSPGHCTIIPDLNSYTNSTNGQSSAGGAMLGQSPTTAVAMIVLYAITGVITALFIVIIVTGAIRAHRHPERYGPRNIAGRGRQSRAKGIARAMLETLPIVKFGDHSDLPKKPAENPDIEMNTRNETTANDVNIRSVQTPVAASTEVGETNSAESSEQSHAQANADGRDDEGQLGCSICTEDFSKGEEVRVLPCNHKFHPECVDPWLLNVSGTCPLCRIDLRPQGEEPDPNAADTGSNSTEGPLPPPLADSPLNRRNTITYLRGLTSGTREERIAALRRLRLERRSSTMNTSEEDRRGLTRRFRERFRIRTVQRETTAENPSSTTDDLERPPAATSSHPETRTS